MTHEERLTYFADAMVNKTFQLKPGETLVITSDYGSRHDLNEAISKAAYQAGAKCIIVITAPAPSHGKIADTVIAYEPFTEMMKEADCWLDTGTMGWLYSDAFETVLATNPNIRYLLISNLDLNLLYKTFVYNYCDALVELCAQIKLMVDNASHIRVGCALGTDLEFEIEHRHVITVDIGNASTPGFFTLPALFNIVPRFGSCNGKLVMSAVYCDPWGLLDKPLTILVRDGKIVGTECENQADADSVMAWLEQWNEENIYKVAHTNLGLLAGVKGLCGEGILDERSWGTLNWGFGHVTPSEAPPLGNISKSHFDGMVLNGSIWIDEVPVMENGRFVHSTLAPLADAVIRHYEDSYKTQQ